MHGKGTFFDPRLDDAAKFPVAARAGFGHVRERPRPDHAASCAALHFYQLALPAPTPPAGSFDAAAAARGKALSSTARRRCAELPRPAALHRAGLEPCTRPQEIGIDDFQAKRSPDERYRTTPLGGLFTRSEGRLLSRRPLRDAARRRRSLRQLPQPGAHRRREGRPGRVSPLALAAVGSQPAQSVSAWGGVTSGTIGRQ